MQNKKIKYTQSNILYILVKLSNIIGAKMLSFLYSPTQKSVFSQHMYNWRGKALETSKFLHDIY